VFSISDLPAINATLNFVSTVFISAGWYFIRRNFWQRHVFCMITAVISSTFFLVGYVTYHVHVGEKSSGFPLVILTLVPVFQRRWDKHRRIAKWTMPIWLYVSVTGVLVYLMLYQWFPPASLAQPR
jgi:putative membrane protein